MIRDLASGTVLGLRRSLPALYRAVSLPAAARAEKRRDLRGSRAAVPPSAAIHAAARWLARAQDYSTTQDGGASRHFSLVSGWGPSYPETTGYIIPTMLVLAKRFGAAEYRKRALRMLGWLVKIQMPTGAFPGGTIQAPPVVPVAFNTGQILVGLAAGAQEFGGRFAAAMCRAADWLVRTQDPDGAWSRFPSPFALGREKAYDVHLAWGLFEAARLEPQRPYAQAAMANVRWALSLQDAHGWVHNCCLCDPTQPLSHTLGYFLRGLLEAYLYSADERVLQAARRTADGLMSALDTDGFLPGRLDRHWRGTVDYCCLAGNVQIAYCWLMLFALTGACEYRDAGILANAFVRRTVRVDGPEDTRGAVKGSFPVHGEHEPYVFPNWACKFFIDSHLLDNTLEHAHYARSSDTGRGCGVGG